MNPSKLSVRALMFVAAGATALWGCGKNGEPGSVTFSGGGAAYLSLSDGPNFDFGSVPVSTSLDKTFTVTNSGKAAATGMTCTFHTSAFAMKGGTYPGETGTCGESLAVGASCTIVVTFAPQYAATFEMAVRINYHNGEAQTSTAANLVGRLNLKGQGISMGSLLPVPWSAMLARL